MSPLLARWSPDRLRQRSEHREDSEARRAAASIIDAVERDDGRPLLERAVEIARGFGECPPGADVVHDRDSLAEALERMARSDRAVLERMAARIGRFAEAQLASLRPLSMRVVGGRAGHTIVPIDAVGCYAPGGRHPLPSSVLMTAVPARVAGVRSVWVASPKPSTATLAAAALAGADGLLAMGGAQAIAVLARGADKVPRADRIVGPGNRFVAAAKSIVAERGLVGIDGIAGPSEILILADDGASPELVAADLLAQAEHDPDAVPILVTTDPTLPDRVDAALAVRLESLPTAEVARAALCNGGAVVAATIDEAIDLSDCFAPEHLEVMCKDAASVAGRCRRYGGVFIGAGSAEVFGDYGIGPNHVLPTAGSARFAQGLSVLDFVRVRTWLDVRPSAGLVRDTARCARIEGLEAHARAALARGS
jgi:phosphoribosyl-ATP pyrophosphohydrolase/phosphoribosyl-AMP cyclohydrolase/histidinol dehydrogenase